MEWIVFTVIVFLAILPSAADRECGDRWRKLLDEIDEKRNRNKNP